MTVSPEQTPRPTTNASRIHIVRDLALYALPALDASMHGAGIAGIASGRKGVLIVGNDRRTGALASWTSVDGAVWDRHWLPGSTFGGGTPELIVGGSFGYLASGWKPGPDPSTPWLWRSADGITWTPSAQTGLARAPITAMVASPWGITVALDLGTRGAKIAVSADGDTWREAVLPAGPAVSVDALVELPDGALVLGQTASTIDSGALSGWRSTDGDTWAVASDLAGEIGRLPNSIDVWQGGPWGVAGSGIGEGSVGLIDGDHFRSITPAPDAWGRLVGGNGGLLWVQGGDRSATCAAAWQFDGQAWRSLDGVNDDRSCLDAASPFVLGSASVADSIVVMAQLGASHDLAAFLVRAPGSSPPGDAIGGMADPPAMAIPDALAATIDGPSECPDFPSTVGTILAIAPRTAVGCFGDRPMTFRAWVVDPGEGYGGTCAAFTPAWIQECVLPDYLLASSQLPGRPILHAMRAPSATGALTGVGRWVLITGHYDDAVSPTCRGVGDVGSVGFQSEIPPAQAVLSCRLAFVVSEIRSGT